jgi:tetratricopeptide (TPR) repeat protein
MTGYRRRATIFGVAGVGLLLCLCSAGASAQAQIEEEPDWLPAAQAQLSSDPDGALALADAGLAAAEHAGEPRAVFEATIARAGLQRRRGHYAEAVLDLEQAILLAHDLAEPLFEARAQAALGVVLTLSGLYPDALEALRRAFALYSEAEQWGRASGVLTNLGNLFSEYGDDAAARDYYLRALAMKREHGISDSVGGLLNNLGDLDREAGEFERARAQFEEAAALLQGGTATPTESVLRSNLGRTLAALGQHRDALAEIDRAEQLAAGGEVRLIAVAHAARAEVYLGLARAEPGARELRDQRLQRALDSALTADRIATGMDDPRRRSRIAALLSEIHAELGQPEQALAQLRESATHLREHARRADLARQPVLAARFHHAQQRSEIAELREREARHLGELQRQRSLAWLLGSGALLLAALAGLLQWQIRQRRRHAAELSARNVELGDALLDAEEQGLRAERLSLLNRQLLALAGNDLRAPLLRIRSLSERLLVEHRGHGPLERQIAAIAQAASDLMRVAEQISDLAAPVERAGRHGPACNLPTLLRSVVEQTNARFLGRDRRVQMQLAAVPPARVEGRGLERVLHELLDAVLQRNPGRGVIGVELGVRDGLIELRIDDPAGDTIGSLNAGDGGVGLAFAGKVLRELGGSVRGDPHRNPPQLVVQLPVAVSEPQAVEG